MNGTYRNPVYPYNCADPYCLKFNGEYWCYCTGAWTDGRIFGIIHSTDLVHWSPVGSAMDPLPEDYPHYWAPEVVYDNGTFYLYYSTGNETYMHLRVATASHPAGPFVDSGKQLTREKFAIDAHVFEDDDGARYLFYAADFLDRDRVGTGTVIDRMIDPFTLAGKPAPVSLAAYDWQIFDPRRAEKGNVRWHTVEGSFTLKRKGSYYQMFSGGNYQNPSYGVAYAVTGDIQSGEEWQQVIDGETTFPILRTVPGKVNGPGHNSVAVGPDNRQLFCVYHVIQSFQPLERVMAVDRLEWVGERMIVLGPSSDPQPAPLASENPLDRQQAGGAPLGKWSFSGRTARQEQGSGPAEVRFPISQPYLLLETWVRSLDPEPAAGAYGIRLSRSNEPGCFTFRLNVSDRSASIEWIDETGSRRSAHFRLPEAFDFSALHQVHFEMNGCSAALRLDRSGCLWTGHLGLVPEQMALFTEDARVEFSALSETRGWEDLFTDDEPADTGWSEVGAGGDWRIESQALRGTSDAVSMIEKEAQFDAYELVINARLVEGSGFGILPAKDEAAAGPWLRIERGSSGVRLILEHLVEGNHRAEEGLLQLPDDFDPSVFQHFRFLKTGNRLKVYLEEQLLGEIPAPSGSTGVGLSVQQGTAEIEMARLTAVTPAQ
ncbi:MAG: family 43 glycosylhydrolase [Chloroflexi bacterium]|nr:family 43 glycosylhydrolase [Chloroflexota bacterium]